eukprot:GHRQ01034634.1.p1 GENE.GHRQ01034634.1~~GHRQ01034634.1.p1  ORF type:complete len:105 (+),score=9.02 GHRQ01034634.1:390-704(+)
MFCYGLEVIGNITFQLLVPARQHNSCPDALGNSSLIQSCHAMDTVCTSATCNALCQTMRSLDDFGAHNNARADDYQPQPSVSHLHIAHQLVGGVRSELILHFQV